MGKCMNCQMAVELLEANGEIPDEALPAKDDYAICNKCGIIGKLDENFNIVVCNDDDLDKLMDANPEMCIQMQAASDMIKKLAEMRAKKFNKNS